MILKDLKVMLKNYEIIENTKEKFDNIVNIYKDK